MKMDENLSKYVHIQGFDPSQCVLVETFQWFVAQYKGEV